MMRGMELLGLRVQDVVTGATGVVEGVSYDLYGCVQAVVRPPVVTDEKTGEQKFPEGRYFDVHRLAILSQQRVMPVPSFEEVVRGPAEKPAR